MFFYKKMRARSSCTASPVGVHYVGMMTDAIINFPEQFTWAPTVERAEVLRPYKRVLVCGMGGSHLAADLYGVLRPELPLRVYSDYGLPEMPAGDWAETLVILFSYSGNTEEVLEAAGVALERKLNIAAIATGGKLLAWAREQGVPVVEIPSIGIQPRLGLGFSLRALEKVLGDEAALAESQAVATLKAEEFLPEARALAQKLAGAVPVIYSSRRNQPIAYNWKIKFNETAKIPAFYNVLPELNHNEMNGFDATDTTRALSAPLHFIFLEDADDHPHVQKRFAALAQMYAARGLAVERLTLAGASHYTKVFASLILADWTALTLAEHYGVESEQVPMVEEFKKIITG